MIIFVFILSAELNEKEVILPEIYIPEIPNKVLIAQYSINGNIWLFMAGFDAGYIYEYPCPLSGKLKHNKPIRSRIIEHAKDIEIHNFFIQYGYLKTFCKRKNNKTKNLRVFFFLGKIRNIYIWEHNTDSFISLN